MDKQTVEYPYNGMPLRTWKEQTIPTDFLDEFQKHHAGWVTQVLKGYILYDSTDMIFWKDKTIMFVARGNTMILWPEDSDGGYTIFYICMKSSYTLYTKADSVLFSNQIPVIFRALLLLKLGLWSLALNRNVERGLGEVEKCSFYCFTRQRDWCPQNCMTHPVGIARSFTLFKEQGVMSSWPILGLVGTRVKIPA